MHTMKTRVELQDFQWSFLRHLVGAIGAEAVSNAAYQIERDMKDPLNEQRT